MGIFDRLKQKLSKTKEGIAFKLHNLFKGNILDDEFYDELEAIFLSADIGFAATERILEQLRDEVMQSHLTSEEQVRLALRKIMAELLQENDDEQFDFPAIIIVAGVNGVGKTTLIGKLAQYYKKKGKSVALAAADTFRAAAADQLTVWADRAGVRIIKQAEGADPAAVVFDAIKSIKSKNTDVLLVDTAGRLHNKKNLMEELKKINRVIEREAAEYNAYSLLVLDSSTGQNALAQTEIFNQALSLDAIALTKLDGTAKGGVALAIAAEYSIPIKFVGVGEGIDDLEEFDANEFVCAII